MKTKIMTINNKLSEKEFNSCELEEISVIIGGYIITPRGEIIIVDEEEHCNVFSDYINEYLEQKSSSKTYDTYEATKILCEIGCCVYAGIRYKEYISNKNEGYIDNMGSLTFPKDITTLSEFQKEACSMLISKNKSLLGNREKIYIQYGSFPDIE